MASLFKKLLIIAAPILLHKWFRGKKTVRKTGLVLFVLIGGIWLLVQYPPNVTQPASATDFSTETVDVEKSDIRSLYEAQRSGVMVSTVGNVTRILKDDNEGSRHQRFLIKTTEGLSLLVAHNIDLAPRVPLHVNDEVFIYGQYEWNNKGGVLHWTHHDPNGKHAQGWIQHQGKKYD